MFSTFPIRGAWLKWAPSFYGLVTLYKSGSSWWPLASTTCHVVCPTWTILIQEQPLVALEGLSSLIHFRCSDTAPPVSHVRKVNDTLITPRDYLWEADSHPWHLLVTVMVPSWPHSPNHIPTHCPPSYLLAASGIGTPCFKRQLPFMISFSLDHSCELLILRPDSPPLTLLLLPPSFGGLSFPDPPKAEVVGWTPFVLAMLAPAFAYPSIPQLLILILLDR